MTFCEVLPFFLEGRRIRRRKWTDDFFMVKDIALVGNQAIPVVRHGDRLLAKGMPYTEMGFDLHEIIAKDWEVMP